MRNNNIKRCKHTHRAHERTQMSSEYLHVDFTEMETERAPNEMSESFLSFAGDSIVSPISAPQRHLLWHLWMFFSFLFVLSTTILALNAFVYECVGWQRGRKDTWVCKRRIWRARVCTYNFANLEFVNPKANRISVRCAFAEILHNSMPSVKHKRYTTIDLFVYSPSRSLYVCVVACCAEFRMRVVEGCNWWCCCCVSERHSK